MFFSSVSSSYFINGKEQESKLQIKSNTTGDKKDEVLYALESKNGQYKDKTGKLTKKQASQKIKKKLKDIRTSFEKYLTQKRRVLQRKKTLKSEKSEKSQKDSKRKS
jgi:hypothetical protein